MRPHFRSSFGRLLAASATIFVVVAGVPVYAASDSWNVDAAGNWATIGSWLSGSQAPGSTTLDNADVATFSKTLTAARVVTVDTDRYIGGITFGNTSAFGYTLSGGTLHLNDTSVIQSTGTTGAHTDTIASSVLLSGTSASFTGASTLATRLLSLGAVTGTSASTTTLTLNGVNTGNNTVGGIIGNGSGGGTLGVTKAAAGTWVLSGANTYTGVTTVNAGILSVATIGDGGVASGNLGSATNAAANLVLGGGTLQYTGATASSDRNFTLTAATTSSINVSTGASNLTLAGASTATTGALTKLGAGTLTLTGANLHTGLTSINAGTLALSGSDNRLASTGTVSFGGTATFDVGSTTQGLAGLTSAVGSFTETINGSTGTINVTGAGPFYVANGSNGTTQTSTLNIAGTTVSFASGSTVRVADQTGSNNAVSTGTLNLNSGGRLNADALVLAYMNYTGGANSASAGGTININNGGTLAAKTVTMQSANHQNGLHNGAIVLNTGSTFLLGTLSAGSSVTTTFTNTITFNDGTIKNYDASTNLAINALIGTTHTFTLGSGTPTFDIGTSRTGTISEPMVGTGSLTKIGAGGLTLSGASTYTGATNVNVGTLSAGVASVANTSGAFGKNSAVTLANTAGASLNITGFNTQIGSLAGGGGSGGNVTLGAATLTTGADNTSTSYAGVVSGTGGLTKTGTGTQTLTGLNTYTGLTTVSGGTLAAGVTNALGTGAVTVNGAAAIYSLGTFNDSVGIVTVDGGGQITSSTGVLTSTGSFEMKSGSVSAILAGSVALNKTTASTATLTGSNTYTGTTAISAGTLKLDFSAVTAPTDNIVNNSANSSALSLSGGTLALTGKASTTNTQRFNGLTVAGGVNAIQLTADVTSNPVLLSLGAITRTGGSVNFVLPAGTQSASNGITTTTPNDANGVLGTWATVGADLATNNGTNIVAYSGYTDVPFAGTIVDGPGTNVRLIGGTSGNIVLGSTVTTVNTILQNEATPTTIDAASQTLRLGALGGIVLPTGMGALTIGTAANSGSLTAGGADNTAGNIALANNDIASLLTVNSVIADNGSGVITLTKTGIGLVNLNGSNTYTGPTTISDGTLQIGGAGQLNVGSYAGTIANNSIFSYNSTATQTLSGIISGTGTLTKSNTGTLTLSAANTYTGLTTVTDGTLAAGIANALGTGAVTVNGATAIYSLGTFSDTVGTVTLDGGGQINSSTGVLTTTGTFEMKNGSVGAILAGSVALNKTTAGTITLTGVNTYTGAITISAGTLQIGGAGKLGAGTYAGTIANTGTLQYSSSANQTLSGAITGTGPLTKDTGTGTLTISAAGTTYTGATTVSAGTLALQNATGFNSAITVANGAALLFNPTVAGGDANVGATIALSGALNYNTAGNFYETWAAPVTVSAATATIDVTSVGITSAGLFLDGGLKGSSNVTVTSHTNGLGLVLRNALGTYSGTMTINGNASAVNGTGSGLALQSAGVSLKNATLTVNGTLELGGQVGGMGWASPSATGLTTQIDALNGTGVVVANFAAASTATLSVGNNNGTGSFSGAISNGSSFGTVSLAKNGTGTQTLSGTSNYTGTTTVTAGTLLINGAKTGAGSVSVASTATLGGTGSIAGATTVNSGGFLAPGGSSAGTLTLATATLGGTYNCQLDVSTGDSVAVTGALTISGGAAITVSTIGTPTAASYTILSYGGTLTGTLPTITGIPSGYNLDTSTAGQVKLVKSGYTAWAAGFAGLTDATPGGDPDHDGISNLLEYVLGGDPRVSSSSILPTQAVVGGNLVLRYKRNDDSKNDTTQIGQWSTDLSTWTDVTPVMVADNGAAPDDMTVTVPLTTAVAGKLFLRLKVTQP